MEAINCKIAKLSCEVSILKLKSFHIYLVFFSISGWRMLVSFCSLKILCLQSRISKVFLTVTVIVRPEQLWKQNTSLFTFLLSFLIHQFSGILRYDRKKRRDTNRPKNMASVKGHNFDISFIFYLESCPGVRTF